MVDDIVQDVFLAAWRGLKSYTGGAPLRNWLLSIARNKVEDHYRRTLGGVLTVLESEDEIPDLTPSADLEGALDAARQATKAATVLTSLPYEYAIALRWRYWEGRSAREMSEARGRSEKAVERLLARARTKFKAQSNHHGQNHSRSRRRRIGSFPSAVALKVDHPVKPY